jgi:hypothetical protein
MSLRHWIIPILLVLLFAMLPARLSWCALCVAELSRWMQFSSHSREENRWRARAEYFEGPYGPYTLFWGRVIGWALLTVLLFSAIAYA